MEEKKDLQNQNQTPDINQEPVENSQGANDSQNTDQDKKATELKEEENSNSGEVSAASKPEAQQSDASEKPADEVASDEETAEKDSGQKAEAEKAEAEKPEEQKSQEPEKAEAVKPDEQKGQEPERAEAEKPEEQKGQEPEKAEAEKPEEQKSQESEKAEAEKPDEQKGQESEKENEEDKDKSAAATSGEGEDVITHHDNEDIYGDEDHQESKELEEEDRQEEEITEEYFSKKSREELLELMKEAVQVENINLVKKKISFVRSAFIQKTKDKKQEDYEKFVEKGAEDEEFVEQPDELEQQFNEVFSVYKQKKAEFNRHQEEQKRLNLGKKNDILERLRELINSEEPLKKTYDEFKVLQTEWRNIGMVPRGEVSELWRNYHFLVEKFFDKVKINQELRDLGLKKNLERKIELCEKAEDLLLEENINKSFKLLQKYHQKWREIGAVPQEKNEEIWQRFKSATDKINDRRREYYDERNEQREENYKAKLALCEKAEELYSEERQSIKDWLNATDHINELFKLWKSIGKAPGRQNDEVWHRFKTLLDKFFTDKKEYFKKLKDYQKENLEQKQAIVDRAEEIKDSEDWKNTKRELIDLQKQWKEIGPVPRKHSTKIWKAFRAACDHFFDRRDKYFKNIHQNEEEHLKKKQEIIEKVKAFELSGEKDKDLQDLKDFQRAWNEVGFVPIKVKDKVQQEFKEALDKHFDKLNISNAEKSVFNYKQKVEHLKDDPNADQRMGRERKVLFGKISSLQEDITLWENNVGFLSNSKKSNQLREEFERKIERSKKELAMLKAKLRYLDKADE